MLVLAYLIYIQLIKSRQCLVENDVVFLYKFIVFTNKVWTIKSQRLFVSGHRYVFKFFGIIFYFLLIISSIDHVTYLYNKNVFLIHSENRFFLQKKMYTFYLIACSYQRKQE